MPSVETVRTIDEVRDAIGGASPVFLVPTMGYFHEGHLSLIRTAAEDKVSEPEGLVAVSLFVNPTQFNDPKDLEAYPRDEERDAALAREAGCDLLFLPTAREMYPTDEGGTRVMPPRVARKWEGEHRPGHFVGVATIVLKLFHIFFPDVAYFGEKDWQQCRVIAEMVRDLNLPVWLKLCPTVREPDGLAMSSRNTRLSKEARARAVELYRALLAVADAAARGEDFQKECENAKERLFAAGFESVDYIAVVDGETLEPASAPGPGLRAIGAATIEGVRLIDNVSVD